MSRREFRQVGFSPHIIQIAGFDGREYTVTGTTAVDLVTIPVSITPKDGIAVSALIRKTSGAAAATNIGIKINGTSVFTATSSAFPILSTTNQAEMGRLSWGLGGMSTNADAPFGIFRATNYTFQGQLTAAWKAATFTATTGGGGTARAPSTTLTTGVISSVTLTGRSLNNAQTLGVKNVTVYRVVMPY